MSPRRFAPACAALAFLLVIVAIASGALWWPGLSHTGHPMALPGAGGARLLLVAGTAWAAQGVFALDLRELDGPAGYLHAAAWTCWWLAAASGLALLGSGDRRGRRLDWTIATLLVLLALLPHWPWPAALSQRLAALAWFGGWLAWSLRGRRVSGLR